MPKKRSVSEVLRRAMEGCGESRYRIAAETGLSESVLCRFAAGETALRLANVDVLADYLGLELRPRKGRGE